MWPCDTVSRPGTSSTCFTPRRNMNQCWFIAILGTKWVTTELTHLGRVTHICVSKLTITGSDNGLSPHRRQAIIWTNAGIFLIGPLGTNFSEILIEILTFSFKKMRLQVSSAKRRPFCLGLDVLRCWDFHSRKCDWKCRLQNISHFVHVSMCLLMF